MNGRKALSLALAGVAVLTLAFGSGAFTSVSAERGVSVAVVGDDEAFVGYNSSDVVVEGGEEAELVTVTNRFAGAIEIEEATLESDGIVDESDLVVDDSSIGPGETASIAWDSPDCSALTASTVATTVEVAGTGVWAEIDGDTETREFEVTCAPPEAVTYTGNAKVEITTADASTVDLKYWTAETSGNGDAQYGGIIENFPTNESVNTQTEFDKPSNHSVVAIYLPEYGVTYVHPNYDVSAAELENLGAGDGQVLEGGFETADDSGGNSTDS
ncbi:MAG: hypothetical protein ACOCUO_01710 [archaeon]